MAMTVLSPLALCGIAKRILGLDDAITEYDVINDHHLMLLRGCGKSFIAKFDFRKCGSLSHFLEGILPLMAWGFYAQTMNEALEWQA